MVTTTTVISDHPIRHRRPPHESNALKVLSPSMIAAELSSALPSHNVLASLRGQVLTYLADIEQYLSDLESPISAATMITKGETTVEEATAWARTGLDMLDRIRSEVHSHFSDLHLTKGDVRLRLDNVCARLSDMEFHGPLDYIPRLHDHLQSLQTHLTSLERHFSPSDPIVTASPASNILDTIRKLVSSPVGDELHSLVLRGEEKLEDAAIQVVQAVKRSLGGTQLIHYMDLPDEWRNNEYVARGYRFIPLREWPLLVLSLFAWHNETVNIHTHFVPFLLWSLNLVPVAPLWTAASSADKDVVDVAVYVHTACILMCLLSSTVWHTMSGCASSKGMNLCARFDYVGIGWSINASVAAFVYYGFPDHPYTRRLFLCVYAVMGLLGTILPFMEWFNDRRHRALRNLFFVSLTLSSIAPIISLCYIYSTAQTLKYLWNVVPSLSAYTLGFVIYVARFPESFLVRAGDHHWLDWIGGGSHALWHVCVVLGMSLFQSGMRGLVGGIQ